MSKYLHSFRKDISLTEFRTLVFHYFQGQNYSLTDPASLISESFNDTFNPSGAHDLVVNLLHQDTLKTNIKKVGIDPCYRHIDLNRSGDDWHSVIFEMLTYVDACPIEKLNIPGANKVIYDFLVNFLGLDRSKLIITYFAGGSVKGKLLEADKIAKESWLNLGIDKNNLIPIENDINYLYTESDGDGAGPRCELYYNYKDQQYIEIATVIYEIYRFNKGNLVETQNAVSGAGIGFERLYAIITESYNLFKSNEYLNIKEIIKSHLTSKILFVIFSKDIDKLTSYLRALVLLSNFDNFKNRKSKLNILIKSCNRICKQLNLSLAVIFTSCFQTIYNDNSRYIKGDNNLLHDRMKGIISDIT